MAPEEISMKRMAQVKTRRYCWRIPNPATSMASNRGVHKGRVLAAKRHGTSGFLTYAVLPQGHTQSLVKLFNALLVLFALWTIANHFSTKMKLELAQLRQQNAQEQAKRNEDILDYFKDCIQTYIYCSWENNDVVREVRKQPGLLVR